MTVLLVHDGGVHGEAAGADLDPAHVAVDDVLELPLLSVGYRLSRTLLGGECGRLGLKSVVNSFAAAPARQGASRRPPATTTRDRTRRQSRSCVITQSRSITVGGRSSPSAAEHGT